ncbi:hypothetical protein P3T76_005345 [Phytophthora citrophthora]|uniref:Crinkler effector protein N-terminal domain-containing protein n=1 Tax=Phytophthora citrophthora TaxID=4793 RepID=A0AAD9GS00_9STRA|nr:hypothetical protein P3T76_005345 [Phytophthora citrophthora]
MKLRCGEGILFSIEIEHDAEVEALRQAMYDYQHYYECFSLPPSALRLYLAGAKEGKETKWLQLDCHVKDFLRGGVSTAFEELLPFCSLNEDYNDFFGGDFQPGWQDIHVLVELPSVEVVMRSSWWLVTGLAKNALCTYEVRSRLYRLADEKLGYYDPANVPSDNKVLAFWYTNNNLQIRVLFKKGECVHLLNSSECEDNQLTVYAEEHALRFQSA